MIINNKNYSKELYLEDSEHLYQLEKLKDRIYLQNYHIMTEDEEKVQIQAKLEGTYKENTEQILDYNTTGNNILLKDKDEKFLLLLLNKLKTSIFYDLILPDKLFNKFNEDMELILDINKIAEDRDIQMTTNEKEELKKYFYMIYSEEDKNKKRISYELKNSLLLKDLEKIRKNRKFLYKNIETLKYEEYKKMIEKQMKIINNINPTIYYYKELLKLLKDLYNKKELEEFVNEKYIKTIEMNIERIRKISDILILMNIRLVINLVKQYMSKVPNNLNFNDIKNEGIIGFMQAIYKFNPFLEQKLSTYATWWIRQAIISTINNFRNIVTVPLYYSKIIKLAEEVENKLSLNKQKTISEEEIVKELNKLGHNITLKKLQTAKQFVNNQNSVTFDNSNNSNEEEGKQSFGDILGFLESDNNVEEEIETEEMIQILKNMIEEQDILTPKEKLIIKQRLPLFTDEPKTLEEIGKKMNRTKERVRQLETDALNKIKQALPLYFEDLDIDFNNDKEEN